MANRDLIVRLVRLEDAPDIQANCFSQNTLAEVRARIAEAVAMHEEERGVQIVAEVEGTVVGTATLIRHDHPLFAHRAELADIVVQGHYQCQGIARRMLEESRAYTHALGIEILETSCRAGTGAEQAYARMGFTEYGRLPWGIIEPGDEPRVFDQVLFYLPLEGNESRGGQDDQDG